MRRAERIAIATSAVAHPLVGAAPEPGLATALSGTLLSLLHGGPACYGQRRVGLHGCKQPTQDQRARFAVASRIATMTWRATGVHDASASLVPGRFTGAWPNSDSRSSPRQKSWKLAITDMTEGLEKAHEATSEGPEKAREATSGPPGNGPGVRRRLVRAAGRLLIVAAAMVAAMGALAGCASATWTIQPGPLPVGNLLSYANSDFEGHADFTPVHNAAISDSDVAFLHAHSLQDTVDHAGLSVFRLQKSDAIGVGGSNTYTLSAYVKLSSASRGQALRFGLACYAAPGRLLKWSYTPAMALVGERSWQYVEAQTTVPSRCGHVVGSPQLAFMGMAAGEAVNVDEVTLRPYRAALVMGAHGNTQDDGRLYSYTATDWLHTNDLLGPLQADKVFYDASMPLPSSWADPANNCYEIERALPRAAWPECVITYKVRESEAQIQSFLAGLPADQQVMMVWWQEPENDAFSGCPGAAGGNGPNFVCYFEQQSSEIRQAAAADGVTPQVLVAMDAETYAYHPRVGPGRNQALEGHYGEAARNGTSCSFIPPGSYVDVYLADQYAYDATSDLDAGPRERAYNWQDWLACVLPQNKPIGVAEYGVNPGDSNPSGTASAIAANASYLAALPTTTHEEMAMWALWDSAPGNWAIDNEPEAVSVWRAAVSQNGGASAAAAALRARRGHHGRDREASRSSRATASVLPGRPYSVPKKPPWWLESTFTF